MVRRWIARRTAPIQDFHIPHERQATDKLRVKQAEWPVMKLPVKCFGRRQAVKRQQHQQRIVLVCGAAILLAVPARIVARLLITNLPPHQANLDHVLVRGPKIRAELRKPHLRRQPQYADPGRRPRRCRRFRLDRTAFSHRMLCMKVDVAHHVLHPGIPGAETQGVV